MRYFLLFLMWLFVGLALDAQNIGKPFIRTFQPQEYGGDTQNWSVLQDPKGIIYVANGGGVLQYDGVNWDLITLPNGVTVRSLGIAPDGKIYVGANNDVGYLSPNQEGKITYHSLVDMIPKAHRNFKHVWTVLVLGKDDVVFHTMTHLFHYKDNKIEVFDDLKNTYHRAFLVDGQVFLRRESVGLYKFTGKGFKLLKNGAFFADKIISSILPHPSGKQLIGTRKSGLFLLDMLNDDGKISKFDSEFNKLNLTIYHGITLKNGNYLYCDLILGLFVVNPQGDIIYNLPEEDLGATPYYVHQDKQGAIWAGLAKGVVRAEINKSISYFGSSSGLRGVVNGMLEVGKRLYACTEEGVFFIQDGKVHTIPELSEQSWFIKRVVTGRDTIIIFSVQEFLYQLEKDGSYREICRLPDGATSFDATASKKHKGLVWIATTDGLGLLRLGAKPTYTEFVNDHEIREVLEDWEGNLWLSIYQNGIMKIEFPDQNDLSRKKIIMYNEKHGLPSRVDVTIFRINGQVFFGTKRGLYQFNEAKKRFVPSDILGKGWRDRGIFHAVEDSNKNVWVTGFNNFKYPIGVAKYQRMNRYKWYDTPFRRIPKMLENNIFLSQRPDVIWITGSEGIFRYQMMTHEEDDLLHDYHTLITKVQLDGDSVLFHGVHVEARDDSSYQAVSKQDKKNIPKLDYKQNSLTFEYASPSYDYIEGNQYAYYLESYDKDWTWSKETKKEYTNLPPGRYVFRVKSKNIYGKESLESQYSFRIMSPWYRTAFAYFLYAILIFIIIWLFVTLYTKRLRKEKEKLEFIVHARTSEIKRKNEVLEAQKNKLAQAVGNISALNEIGRKITSSLELEDLVKTIYRNVNNLSDAPVFGVGSYNANMHSIEFKGYIENGTKHSYTSESLYDEDKFSVWCFKHQKEIIINDLQKDYSKYLKLDQYTVSDNTPKSLIYLPLLIDKHPVGVLTLQSYHTNAYKDLDLTVLRSLASYVAIALENAKSYEVIKENNIKITDSIRYAETIQRAILPTDMEMKEAFEDYFVIFKPKDIVSGDFYWISHTSERTLIAAVDCTGHGVPGAFMSMVGTDLLTEIVNTHMQPVPYLMLERLDKRIQEALRQDKGFNNDGMDICMTLIEYQKDSVVQISFTGAKRPLYYYKKDHKTLDQLKGDKKSVGGLQRKRRNFTNQTIFLKKGDLLYLSSDGIVDQPNKNGVKFGTPYFQQVLNEHAEFSLKEQCQNLESKLTKHMGSVQQRDDIVVIGIEL